jgi:hypothetical protein
VCDTFRVVVIGGVGDTDVGGLVVTSFACKALIILNNLAMRSFVDQMAYAYSCSPTSMFWSLSISICNRVVSFAHLGEGKQGVIGATEFL